MAGLCWPLSRLRHACVKVAVGDAAAGGECEANRVLCPCTLGLTWAAALSEGGVGQGGAELAGASRAVTDWQGTRHKAGLATAARPRSGTARRRSARLGPPPALASSYGKLVRCYGIAATTTQRTDLPGTGKQRASIRRERSKYLEGVETQTAAFAVKGTDQRSRMFAEDPLVVWWRSAMPEHQASRSWRARAIVIPS
jgi:hypothetical protein